MKGTHPRERDTPGETALLELLSAGDQFSTDGLHRLGMQAPTFFRGTSGEFVEVDIGTKAILALQNAQRGFVAIVPYKIHLPGLCVQENSVFVFNAKTTSSGGAGYIQGRAAST